MEEQPRGGENLALRRIDEEPRQQVGTGHQHDEGEECVAEHQSRGDLDALPDAFGLHGAVVVARVGGHRHAEALERRDDEHLDAHAGREGRHAGRAEGVVGALEHDAADGRDRELQSHRQSDRQQRAGVPRAEPPFVARAAQNLEMAVHVGEAERG